MNLDFDFDHVTITEFGVGHDEEGSHTFCYVPVDGMVQTALCEMAAATWEAMQNLAEEPVQYEPTEKYDNEEYVFLPIDGDLAAPMRDLHEANNLTVDTAVLSDPSNMFCYFVRLTDKDGRRLTALRRATHFKGVLKARLIRLVSDALTIIEDKVFKLDHDFDLLIDSSNVHILRPSGFEFVGKLQEAILQAVPDNTESIKQDLEFVDFANIQDYASTHTRAARYLASIRSQQLLKNVDRAALKALCRKTGVEILDTDGVITIQEGHIMGFLEVLDRRRYEVELVKGTPESYKASSRRKIDR